MGQSTIKTEVRWICDRCHSSEKSAPRRCRKGGSMPWASRVDSATTSAKSTSRSLALMQWLSFN